jgi:hypothetical protein
MCRHITDYKRFGIFRQSRTRSGNKAYLILGKLIRTRVILVAIGPPQGNKK